MYSVARGATGESVRETELDEAGGYEGEARSEAGRDAGVCYEPGIRGVDVVHR